MMLPLLGGSLKAQEPNHDDRPETNAEQSKESSSNLLGMAGTFLGGIAAAGVIAYFFKRPLAGWALSEQDLQKILTSKRKKSYGMKNFKNKNFSGNFTQSKPLSSDKEILSESETE